MIQFGDERVASHIWDKLSPCPVTACWLATCALRNGYGCARIGGRMVYLHRYMYITLIAPLPPWRETGDPKIDVELDHKRCQTRCCANAMHLEPVTGRINTLRGDGLSALNAVKTSCPHGHVYTPENTRIIRHAGREARRCIECSRARDRIRVRTGGIEMRRSSRST